MAKQDWLWMPHPLHFILGYRCMFRLGTYVNGYIISTVGELVDSFTDYDNGVFQSIGSRYPEPDYYETMIFEARDRENDPDWNCCPYAINVEKEIDCRRYKTATEAAKGHYEWCERIDRGEINGSL